MAKRIVHYINQFYGGIGGEEAAGAPLAIKDGPIGPGIALQKELGEGYEILMTIVCAATMTRKPQTGDCDCDRNFAASTILTLMYSAGHNRISHIECRL